MQGHSNSSWLFKKQQPWGCSWESYKTTTANEHRHTQEDLRAFARSHTPTIVLYQAVSRLKSFSHFRIKEERQSQFLALCNEPPSCLSHTYTYTVHSEMNSYSSWHVFVQMEHVLLSATKTSRCDVKKITISVLSCWGFLPKRVEQYTFVSRNRFHRNAQWLW